MAIPTPTIFSTPQNSVDSGLTGGTALGVNVIRMFQGYQKIMSPQETPVSSSAKQGSTVNQKKVEWGTQFLAPNQVTLGAAQADGTGTTLTLAAGEGAKVMLTDLILVENELQWVVSKATDTLTVKRAMSGTTGVAHTLNGTDGNPRVLEIISPAALENADTPLAPVAKGGIEFNLPQIWDYAIQVSQLENNTPDYEYNSGPLYNAILKKRMKEAAIHFEKAMILGQRASEAAATGATATPSTMGGLQFFTDNIKDLAGAAITEQVFGDMLQQSWSRVGSDNTPDVFLCGGFMKRAISSIWNSNRYATIKDTESNLVWNSVTTDFGTVKFTLSRYIPAGEGYLVDMSDINKHAYAGSDWQEVQLPAAGPYKRGRFTGIFTTTWRGNQKRIRIKGASTTPTDYANM